MQAGQRKVFKLVGECVSVGIHAFAKLKPHEPACLRRVFYFLNIFSNFFRCF